MDLLVWPSQSPGLNLIENWPGKLCLQPAWQSLNGFAKKNGNLHRPSCEPDGDLSGVWLTWRVWIFVQSLILWQIFLFCCHYFVEISFPFENKRGGLFCLFFVKKAKCFSWLICKRKKNLWNVQGGEYVLLTLLYTPVYSFLLIRWFLEVICCTEFYMRTD